MSFFYKKSSFLKFLNAFVAVVFLLTSNGAKIYASVLPGMVAPGTLMSLSAPFTAPSLIGLQLHPEDPLTFSFILGQGGQHLDDQKIKKLAQKSIRYFLAGLAIPEKDLWVNLSPHEKDRVISDVLGFTDAGQDMLKQDYILKQLTASLTYPETALGKKFWKKVYAEAKKRFGTSDIPMEAFNKVWIVPDHSVVYETTDRAVIGEAKLKVMLESDYLSWKEHRDSSDLPPAKDISNDVMREVVIPLLEKEVNTGKQFATLRQIFHALILSSWFKDRLKQSAVAQVYGNKKKIAGIAKDDQRVVEEIYQNYLKAYKVGAYDFIKEDVQERTGEVVPRRYFSGGERWDNISASREDRELPRPAFDRVAGPLINHAGAVKVDTHFNALAEPPSDYAQLAAHSKNIQTPEIPVNAKRPHRGYANVVEIKKDIIDPNHIRRLLVLMGLDYFIEMLDGLYPTHKGWSRALDFIGRHDGRDKLRLIIQQLGADFKFFQGLSADSKNGFQSGTFRISNETLRTASQPLQDLIHRIQDTVSEEEREQELMLLRSIANDPGNIDHVHLLLGEEIRQKYLDAKIGDTSVYGIIEQIIKNPKTLPDIPGLDTHVFIDVAIEQRAKFNKTFDLITADIKKAIEETKGTPEEMIFQSYLFALNSERNRLLRSLTKGKKNQNQTAVKQKENEFKEDVESKKITDEQKIAETRANFENEMEDAKKKDARFNDSHSHLVNEYVDNISLLYAAVRTMEVNGKVIGDRDQYIRDERDKIQEYMTKNRPLVNSYVKNHPEEIDQYKNLKSKEADEALYLQFTAAGYMDLLLDFFDTSVIDNEQELQDVDREYHSYLQEMIREHGDGIKERVAKLQKLNLEEYKVQHDKIKSQEGGTTAEELDKLKNLKNRWELKDRMVTMSKEVRDISLTMFREVGLLWVWHTDELQNVFKNETTSEVTRAKAKVDQYLTAWKTQKNIDEQKSPDLREAAFVAHMYEKRVKALLDAYDYGSGQGTTHSYRYLLEKALTDTLDEAVQYYKIITPEEVQEFRKQLVAIKEKIRFAAEVQMPPIGQYGSVDVIVNHLLSPADYRELYRHFGGKLRNIITTKGTITSHYTFLAEADRVGVIVVDKKELPTDIKQFPLVHVTEGESRFSIRFDTQRRSEAQVTAATGESAKVRHAPGSKELAPFFTYDPDSFIAANADTPDDAAKANEYKASAIGLNRSENLEEFELPTQELYFDKWVKMAERFPSKMITLRAFDLKPDKRNMMLAHVTYTGKKFYLEDKLGVEIFKEQLRAFFNLRLKKNFVNFRFMLPMVETEEDLRRIKTIVDEVLSEKEFGKLKEKSPFDLGIMLETVKALSIKADKWVEFGSIGSNDLISEIYGVDRGDENANKYYENICPKVIRAIIKIFMGKIDTVCICGELASKQRFWIIREMLLHDKDVHDIIKDMRIRQALEENGVNPEEIKKLMAPQDLRDEKIMDFLREKKMSSDDLGRLFKDGDLELGLSMPSSDIPVYNAVNEVFNTPGFKESSQWLRVKELLIGVLTFEENAEGEGVEKEKTEEKKTDVDDVFLDDLNDALLKLSAEVDGGLTDLLEQKKKEQGEAPADETTNDKAMLRLDKGMEHAEGQNRYGGIDFSTYRKNIEVRQQGPALTVPAANGQTIKIGGPDFAGFTFSIINITPYTAPTP